MKTSNRYKNHVDWTEEWEPGEEIDFIRGLALAHALKGGEQGERLASFIRSDSFLEICDFELDYCTLTVSEAANCRQAMAFYQKKANLSIRGVDPKVTAKRKFLEAELACSVTNDILRKRASGLFNFKPQVDSVLRRAQSKIARVLGELPHISALKLRLGPGATTSTKKKNASVVEKLQAGLACSEQLVPHLSSVLGELPGLCELHSVEDDEFSENLDELFKPLSKDKVLEQQIDDEEEAILERQKLKHDHWHVPVEIHDGVVGFVPKNAKSHRSIVVEPVLNTLVQLALGDYMEKRLRAFGIDIKDQTLNKSLAALGSLTGGLGTLDLSNASDTISTELVYELLPWEWAFMLASCRTETVDIDGLKIVQEKFSSMGNGYTFPLETLIFWALASSASRSDYASVYGDDIIVKTDDVPLVIEVLEVCGFSVNPSKSFWTGPFRESCGGDYLRGIDIRPFYLKKVISGLELFKLHNFYIRQGDAEGASVILGRIHPALRIYGPDGYGDGHLLGDWSPRAHKRAGTHGYGGVLFDTFQLSAKRDFRPQRKGDRVLPVYTVYSHERTDRLPARSCEGPNRVRFTPLHRLAIPGLLDEVLRCTPEAIPERVSPVDGVAYKLPSLPGTEGYRRVSIYTMNRG